MTGPLCTGPWRVKMTKIQDLLNIEARLSNNGQKDSEEYQQAHIKIKELRGTEAPVCWGDDDCSTLILSQCPWRIDCYKE
jgi:hypothetical protein